MSKYLRNIFCHSPLFLAKELYNSNQYVNDETAKDINDALIELKKHNKRKKFLKIKIQIKQLVWFKKS